MPNKSDTNMVSTEPTSYYGRIRVSLALHFLSTLIRSYTGVWPLISYVLMSNFSSLEKRKESNLHKPSCQTRLLTICGRVVFFRDHNMSTGAPLRSPLPTTISTRHTDRRKTHTPHSKQNVPNNHADSRKCTQNTKTHTHRSVFDNHVVNLFAVTPHICSSRCIAPAPLVKGRFMAGDGEGSIVDLWGWWAQIHASARTYCCLQMRGFQRRVHSSKFPDGPEGCLGERHHVCRKAPRWAAAGRVSGRASSLQETRWAVVRTGGSTMGDSTVGSLRMTRPRNLSTSQDGPPMGSGLRSRRVATGRRQLRGVWHPW